MSFVGISNKLFLEGHILELNNADSNFSSFSEYRQKVISFIQDWENPSLECLSLYTSGSTGVPKTVVASKKKLLYSAQNTLRFLEIKPESKALCCLNIDFIAGKMMLIRSFVGALSVYICAPHENPFEIYDEEFDFAAFVPIQLEKYIHGPHFEKLNLIKTIIVGGAAMSNSLIKLCQQLKSDVYETYGMTETYSHIALRNIKKSPSFSLIYPEMEIRQDNRGCLMFKGIITQNEWIITNDMVEIDGLKSFKFLGRLDFIINSGGIKINPMEIEAQISDNLKIAGNFIVSSIPDNRLGEKLVLVVEKNADNISLDKLYFLDKYHRPKEIVVLNEFPITKSGKVDRMKIKNSIFVKK